MRFSAPAPAARLAAPAARRDIGISLPTAEQQAILDAYRQGGHLVVEALAGTGKTTTLRMLAACSGSRRGVYIAYNKAIVREAEGRFPEGVHVATAHSLAYQAVGRNYSHRLAAKRQPATEVAKLLRVKPTDAGGAMLSPAMLVRLANATIERFCHSADLTFTTRHLPAHAHSLGEPNEVLEAVKPTAQKIWTDLLDPRGRLRFTHDHYLKIWQLTGPRIPTDYILFDEAQDANPAIAAVVAAQHHAQLVYVGDRNQQLYAWRGATDAMDDIDGERLALTKSFRFGPAIADEANRWLRLLGSPHQVVGHEPVGSRIGPVEQPDAILCRTNGTALGQILRHQEQGVPVGLAPGDRSAGADIRAFAFAARDLMAGRGTDHPELCAFRTWGDLLDYLREDEDSDLQRMVNIINRIGPNGVIDAMVNLAPKEKAQVMVSTAHKAKGLEWDRVQVADDFAPPREGEQPDRAELMLAYVTVTRAKKILDPGTLDPDLWS